MIFDGARNEYVDPPAPRRSLRFAAELAALVSGLAGVTMLIVLMGLVA